MPKKRSESGLVKAGQVELWLPDALQERRKPPSQKQLSPSPRRRRNSLTLLWPFVRIRMDTTRPTWLGNLFSARYRTVTPAHWDSLQGFIARRIDVNQTSSATIPR
jgi:hypothetical protein